MDKNDLLAEIDAFQNMVDNMEQIRDELITELHGIARQELGLVQKYRFTWKQAEVLVERGLTEEEIELFTRRYYNEKYARESLEDGSYLVRGNMHVPLPFDEYKRRVFEALGEKIANLIWEDMVYCWKDNYPVDEAIEYLKRCYEAIKSLV